MKNDKRFKLIKGGAETMEATTTLKGVITTNSANKVYNKTDWEELAEECQAFAKETNLTDEEIKQTLTSTRKLLNACGC